MERKSDQQDHSEKAVGELVRFVPGSVVTYWRNFGSLELQLAKPVGSKAVQCVKLAVWNKWLRTPSLWEGRRLLPLQYPPGRVNCSEFGVPFLPLEGKGLRLCFGRSFNLPLS